MTRAVDVAGRGVRVNGRSVGVGSAIPDSAVAQFDAQALSGSDGDSVSTWPDQIGNHDATGGNPTIRENGINGHQSLEFDGSTDAFSVGGLSVSAPFTYAAVVEINDPSSQMRILDRESGNVIFYWNNGTNWRIIGGSIIDGSSDSSKQLITAIYDGGSSSIREDGAQTGSGDIGSASATNPEIAKREEQNGDYWNGYLGEIMVYDDALSGVDLESEEQRLADKWGISI